MPKPVWFSVREYSLVPSRGFASTTAEPPPALQLFSLLLAEAGPVHPEHQRSLQQPSLWYEVNEL